MPKVGIFFVVGKQLWIDSTPVTEAQAFAGMKTHDKGHESFWEELQGRDAVSKDVEYLEISRGRACWSVNECKPLLLVDPLHPQGPRHD